MKEFAIEWFGGETTATVTAPVGTALGNKLLKLSESTDEVKIVSKDDEYILAHIPTKYVKVSPPRKMSEEQKQAASERFKEMWKNKN